MRFISDLIKRRTVAHKDLLIIILVSMVTLLLAVYFDAFDRFVHWYVKQTEPAELEEIIIVIFILAFAFAIFSWRRWRELKEIEGILRQERDRLQDALAKVKTLRGLLPICSSCKKIRDDNGFWHQVETYVRANTDAEFTHGICPNCMMRLYPSYIKDKTNDEGEQS